MGEANDGDGGPEFVRSKSLVHLFLKIGTRFIFTNSKKKDKYF